MSYFASQTPTKQTFCDAKRLCSLSLSNEAIDVRQNIGESSEKPDEEFCTFDNIFGIGDLRAMSRDQVQDGFWMDDCLSASSRPRMYAVTALQMLSTQPESCSIAIEEHPPKRMKTSPAVGTLVHRACCNPRLSVNDLAQLLLQDPFAISRTIELMSWKEVYNPSSGTIEHRTVPETYSYPLNLAIEHGASLDVIQMLVTSDPSVILKKDGPQGETSLLILLKRSPSSHRTVDLLLLSDPRCALATDRHQNTALHVACFSGASLLTVQHLCMVNQEAMAMRNFHGRTPLQVAQNRISSCSDDVVEFLWGLSDACTHE